MLLSQHGLWLMVEVDPWKSAADTKVSAAATSPSICIRN
jgi:hypothetical protein